LPLPELLSRYLSRYWAHLETGRGLPSPPLLLRAGHRILERRWFDSLAEQCEAHAAYLEGKAPTPHPRQAMGRQALRDDVVALLVICHNRDRKAIAARARRGRRAHRA